MSFQVNWLTLNGAVIREETYDDLEAALEEADLALVGGSQEIDVIVKDQHGNVVSRISHCGNTSLDPNA